MKGSSGGRRGVGMRGWMAVLLVAAGALALAAPAARAQATHWDEGRNWISVRAGYARYGARFAPGGSFGYGFGYSWFLGKNVAWSASVGHDLLGRFGGAALIQVPITAEFTRHFAFTDQTRPYLGLGWGAVYHKTYRTQSDESGFRQGVYVATGANAVLSDAGLIGLDVRWMLQQDSRSINPTFPNGEPSANVLSAKLSVSRAF